MATETGPDLSFAAHQVERLMDDSCRIARPLVDPDDPPAVYDATTHPDHASGDEGGARVMVSDGGGATGSGGLVDADDAYRYTHTADVPRDVTEVREGDVLTVLTSRRDPALVGTDFIVRKVIVETFAVSRTLGLEHDVPARRYEEVSGP